MRIKNLINARLLFLVHLQNHFRPILSFSSFMNSLIYLFRIENMLWFSEGDSGQYDTMWHSFLVDANIPKSSEWRVSHPPLSCYSRRLLVSGIARSGHHKSIHTASRSCFEVVLWYTWLHRMQHRKATWYDITQYIKENRSVARNIVTILSKRNPYDTGKKLDVNNMIKMMQYFQ